MSKILITGGAGFIGSYTADALIKGGHQVRILDNLHPQIHGLDADFPQYLSPEVETIRGDIRERNLVGRALEGIDVIYHLASETGVGQSQYEIARYFDVNVTGTGVLWEAIAEKRSSIQKVILASSRAVYGEGAYFCPQDGAVFPAGRNLDSLSRADWSMKCPVCEQLVISAPTDETSVIQPTSIYAQTKKIQEETCRLMGKTYGIPVVSLRYFNVYGPRQALSNPYTGVIATFCTRLMKGKPITIYEEGIPQRDFVHVRDVIQANLLALQYENPNVPYPVFNVGSGIAMSLEFVAKTICDAMGYSNAYTLSVRHRIGDILSCYADLQRSRDKLNYKPTVSFKEGVCDMISWIRTQSPVDLSDKVSDELINKGLLLVE
ncbi:MAG: NAD-dependent epimerase/dehydratase family protein [Flavisolibacter sp.]